MTLTEILAKLKELGAEATFMDAVKALDNGSEVDRLKGELEAEQGKNAGILADKKKYKERATTAEKSLADAEHAKLPEKERQEAERQKLVDDLAKEKSDRATEQAENAKVLRDGKLSDLTGSIRWAKGTPQDTAKLIVSKAFAGVDDFSDQAKVDEVLNGVKDSHKSFISSAAPVGADTKGGDGQHQQDEDEESSIESNQKDLWGEK